MEITALQKEASKQATKLANQPNKDLGGVTFTTAFAAKKGLEVADAREQLKAGLCELSYMRKGGAGEDKTIVTRLATLNQKFIPEQYRTKPKKKSIKKPSSNALLFYFDLTVVDGKVKGIRTCKAENFRNIKLIEA